MRLRKRQVNMNKKIGILDYGIGNIRSVYNAVNHVGFEPELLTSPADIKNYHHIIVPGVGNFGHVVEEFSKFEFDTAMQDYISSGGYCLGICVGMQMLFDVSEESPNIKGLGLIPGQYPWSYPRDPPGPGSPRCWRTLGPPVAYARFQWHREQRN